MTKLGILLTNTGTPDAPTRQAVRHYLREFLSDKRMIHLPKLFWLPILHGLILPFRPRMTSALYQKIWTKEGSPMRSYMEKLAALLQSRLNENKDDFQVAVGMNYGSPSIQKALENFKVQHIDKILILPLFPQYSHTTTASSFDRVHRTINAWRKAPNLRLIDHYSNEAAYIQTFADHIHRHWATQGISEHLLISFHSIPKSYVRSGDPYQMHCEKTAYQLAEALKLPKDRWTLSYQSRIGRNSWLTPETDYLLTSLPKQGIDQVDVVCPGFAVDCLETLEEIAIRGKAIFLNAGGKTLRYIPALNHTESHIAMLSEIIRSTSNP